MAAIDRWRPYGTAMERWEPFRNANDIQREMNRLFDSFFGSRATVRRESPCGRRWSTCTRRRTTSS